MRLYLPDALGLAAFNGASSDLAESMLGRIIPLPGLVAKASTKEGEEGFTVEVPTEIHVVPIGEWKGYQGWRTIQITAGDCLKIVENQAVHGDVLVDYEHQVLYTEYNGQPAPAAGWIKKVEARDDGCWATVEWTPRAIAAIAAKEFRYLSPVVVWGKVDGKSGAELGTFLHSVALTNNPFFKRDLRPLTARSPSPAPPASTPTNPGDDMALRALLLAALALPDTTTDEQITATATAHKDKALKADETHKVIAKALGLPEDAPLPDDVGAKITAATDKRGLIPLADAARLMLEAKAQGAADPVVACKAAIKDAVKAGKLLPALEPHYASWAEKDAAACSDALKGLGQVVPLTAQADTAGTIAATAAGVLSDEEKVVAKQLGLSEKDFLAAKNGTPLAPKEA